MTAPLKPWGGVTLSTAFLVAVNLIPLFGVLFRGWEVFPLMALFWFENVIVGVWNWVKMATVRPPHPCPLSKRVPMMVFFAAHYGGFAVGHGLFVATLFGPENQYDNFRTLQGVLTQPTIMLAIAGMAISHGASYFFNFIGNGEYRRLDLGELMKQPYGRVVVLHVALIGGGLLVEALGSPLAGLLLLVALKLGVDVVAHRREHAAVAGPVNAEN